MDTDMFERQEAAELVGDKNIYSGSLEYYDLLGEVTKILVKNRKLKAQVKKLKEKNRG